jgi:hypothetical protein
MSTFATAPMPLTQHRLFSAGECAGIRDRVLALRDRWIRRSADGFYSLGTSTYLDAPGRRAEYLASARKTNPLLLAEFSDVYAAIAGFFEEFLFAPVVVASEVPVPGFHVFEFAYPGPENDSASARAHFDLQWIEAFPGLMPQATVSFTVAIEQPPRPAAMEVWALRYEESARVTGPVGAWAAEHPARRMPYADGGMTVHDGNILHAIGSRSPGEAPGRRLTLQGHGVQVGGTWTLYW